MDLPIDVSSKFLVSGRDELYQDLRLVLTNEKWSFFSSYRLGSNVSLHTDDTFVLSEQVKSTIQTIRGAEVKKVDIDRDYNAYVQMTYNGLFVDFNFNLNEL